METGGGEGIERTAWKSLLVVVFATTLLGSDGGRVSSSARFVGGSNKHHFTFRSKSRSEIRYWRPG